MDIYNSLKGLISMNVDMIPASVWDYKPDMLRYEENNRVICLSKKDHEDFVTVVVNEGNNELVITFQSKDLVEKYYEILEKKVMNEVYGELAEN